MTGIGSRAIPELYAKPYSLTVNFQSLHFYFSCMHSARMLRSTGKYNTDCAILSYNLSRILYPGRASSLCESEMRAFLSRFEK